MPARVSFLVALLVAVLGAGCAGKTADQALAEKAVLRSSDLPGGTGGGGPGWYVDKVVDKSLAGRCVKPEFPGFTVTGRAHSDWFSSPASWLEERNWQLASFSRVYEDAEDQALEQLAKQATKCIQQQRAANDDLTTGPPVGVAKIREIPFPSLGESSRMYEIKSGSGPDGPGVTYDYVVLVHAGRALILLYVVSDSNASHDHLIVEFAKTITSRM